VIFCSINFADSSRLTKTNWISLDATTSSVAFASKASSCSPDHNKFSWELQFKTMFDFTSPLMNIQW
jgi:hypothetical protein